MFIHHSIFRFSVIVGAPTEDTSQVQRDVHRGGAVFKCDVRENDKCIMIPFDRNGEFTIYSLAVCYTMAINY